MPETLDDDVAFAHEIAGHDRLVESGRGRGRGRRQRLEARISQGHEDDEMPARQPRDVLNHELGRDRVEDARNSYKVGDTVEAKIVSVDRKNRSLALSVKAKDYEDEQEAVKSLKEQETEAASPGTIGDLIKAQMSDK